MAFWISLLSLFVGVCVFVLLFCHILTNQHCSSYSDGFLVSNVSFSLAILIPDPLPPRLLLLLFMIGERHTRTRVNAKKYKNGNLYCPLSPNLPYLFFFSHYSLATSRCLWDSLIFHRTSKHVLDSWCCSFAFFVLRPWSSAGWYFARGLWVVCNKTVISALVLMTAGHTSSSMCLRPSECMKDRVHYAVCFSRLFFFSGYITDHYLPDALAYVYTYAVQV